MGASVAKRGAHVSKATSTQQQHQQIESSAATFSHIPKAPPDPILSLTERYRNDPSDLKVNLGVGAYRTDNGSPLVLRCVKRAEQAIFDEQEGGSVTKEYAPIEGLPPFNEKACELVFGKNCLALDQDRVASVQALSGTGALRVAFSFLYENVNPPAVYIPTPSWGNHAKIVPASGLNVVHYPHFDQSSRMLEEEGLLKSLSDAPAGSVVLLHACAHNPTGVDPSEDQWHRILDTIQQNNLVPFFDVAYQGFATGDFDADAFPVRLFEHAGLDMIVAQSFAKNMGLYGERVGALHVVTQSEDEATNVKSQLKQSIRPMYSSPPVHGALIADRVMSDPELKQLWEVEVNQMTGRIKRMRTMLRSELERLQAPGDWSHITSQIGMFSFTGLTAAQCANMIHKWHVYMTSDGRISLAGLSDGTCPYVAEAIKDSIESCRE